MLQVLTVDENVIKKDYSKLS